MARATSNLLMLIPVPCCCVCWVSPCMARMWQQLRADEGGHPQHSLPQGSVCSFIFAWGSMVQPRGCTRAAKWNKSLDIGFTDVGRGWAQACLSEKVSGANGVAWRLGGRWWVGNTFQRSVQHVPLQRWGPRDQKAMVAFTLYEQGVMWVSVRVRVLEKDEWACVCDWDVILAAWV